MIKDLVNDVIKTDLIKQAIFLDKLNITKQYFYKFRKGDYDFSLHKEKIKQLVIEIYFQLQDIYLLYSNESKEKILALLLNQNLTTLRELSFYCGLSIGTINRWNEMRHSKETHKKLKVGIKNLLIYKINTFKEIFNLRGLKVSN